MSPHVRYDILLANLYFKNIHQSEDFQERRGVHGMNLESVVVGSGGGGEAGEVEGRGGEAHPSFPSSPGWRDSCGPPEEEEEEEEEREERSICCSSTSELQPEREKWRRQEKEGFCSKASSSLATSLVPELQLRICLLLPPPRRRSAAPGANRQKRRRRKRI